MILFLLSAILSFVWRIGSVSDQSDRPPLADRAALGPCIAITCVLIYIGTWIYGYDHYDIEVLISARTSQTL